MLADLVHVGQDLRHGQVQTRRDFLLKLSGVVDRPRQRRGFQQQDVVFGANFSSFERQKVAAFGQQHRRPAVFWVVFKGHGVVRRVGVDHRQL